MKPFDEFMALFNDKVKNNIFLHDSDMTYQIGAIQEYGKFLAEVGRDNFERVASELADKINRYAMARDEVLHIGLTDEKSQIAKHQKRTQTFRSYLHEPNITAEGETATAEDIAKLLSDKSNSKGTQANLKYLLMLKLLEEYQNDLDRLSSDINMIQDTKILPSTQFSKPQPTTKTELRDYLVNLVKKYQIQNGNRAVKNLLAELDNPL